MTESGKSQGGGNLKYIVGGLLLLCGAAVVIFMLKPPAEVPAPEQAPAPPKSAERVNPMAQPEFVLDEPADAGKPAEEQAAAKEKPKAQAKEARDEWDCDGDLSRESLQAVPQAFREACWNMGATRWQTIRRVVLPNSLTGILTGVILEVSRTAGETAPIMFTGAVFFTPFLPQSVFDQTMALSLHLFVTATQVPGISDEVPFAVALVLIGLVLTMNSVSIAFRMWLRGKKKW